MFGRKPRPAPTPSFNLQLQQAAQVSRQWDAWNAANAHTGASVARKANVYETGTIYKGISSNEVTHLGMRVGLEIYMPDEQLVTITKLVYDEAIEEMIKRRKTENKFTIDKFRDAPAVGQWIKVDMKVGVHLSYSRPADAVPSDKFMGETVDIKIDMENGRGEYIPSTQIFFVDLLGITPSNYWRARWKD